MTKSTKIIAALGVAAGLGIAALPAGAIFADNTLIPLDYGTANDAAKDVQVKLTVDESIALAVQHNVCTASATLHISDTGSCKNVIAGATNGQYGFTLSVATRPADAEHSIVAATDYMGLNGGTQSEASAKVAAVDGTAVSAANPGWNMTGGALTNAAAKTTAQTVMKTNAAKQAEVDMTYNFATRADQQAGDYWTYIQYTIAKNGAAVATEEGMTNARVIVSNAPASSTTPDPDPGTGTGE